MSYSDEEIEFTDGFEEPEQNIIDQAAENNQQTPIPSGGEQISAQSTAEPTVPEYSLQEKYQRAFSAVKSPEEHDALVEMFKAELAAKQAMQLSLGMDENGMPLSGNALFNSIKSGNFPGDPKVAKSFADKVQYNLQTNLGPTSTVGVDSVLTAWEADNGYYLSPDEFGIYRKFKNGIIDADDAYKVSILDGAYDKAVHDAFTELLASNSDVLPKSEVQGNSSNVSPKTVNGTSIGINDSSYGLGLSDAFKHGLVFDSSGRIVPRNGGNNVSDIVYRGSGQTIQGKIDVVALSTSYKNYWFEQQRAVDYAHQFWLVPNILGYHFYKSSDCTNFVSQCWVFAGIPTTEGWTPGTFAWTTVDGFAQYHVAAGNCYLSYSSSDAKVGDVIQFYNDSKGGWYHAVIITKIDEAGNIYYSGHTMPRDDKPLSEVYPGIGDQIRFLCVKEQLRHPRDIMNFT